MTAGDFDLDGYLARIGWSGPPAPDLATLRRLVAHHTAAIPFEGIDALLGRTPTVDAAGLQAKLVGARRGGWCFEQNSLLALALGALGFRARPLLARVVFGLPPGVVLSRTHMVLRVELPEGPYMVDAGFGGVTLTGAVALGSRAAQPTPHGPFRLVDRPDGLLLQALVGGDWVGLYVVAADPQMPADIEAANWLVANRPGGLFTANLVASRAPAGRRLTLLNRRLTLREETGREVAGRDASGGETVTLLAGPALGAVLRREFGLALGEAELAAIEAALALARPGHIAA
jgi:N-hydroxyarylamine O-acetyltransferase